MAVGQAEEAHVGDTDGGGGRQLLLLPQGGQLDSIHVLGRARLAGGGDGVDDLGARGHEGGDGAGHPEVDVVGMGGDDQRLAGRGGEVDVLGGGHRREATDGL